MQETVEFILTFWFSDLKSEEDIGSRSALWWGKSTEIDEYIRTHFKKNLLDAKEGKYDHWLKMPRSTLALIVLLDQFPRHIYRNQPQAFSFDDMALNYSKKGLSLRHDKNLMLFERVFFYMPFEHAEDLSAQEASVKLFYQLYKESSEKQRKTLKDYHTYAKQHRDIILRFGHFPHRNKILGRPSTEEEVSFLQEPNSSF